MGVKREFKPVNGPVSFIKPERAQGFLEAQSADTQIFLSRLSDDDIQAYANLKVMVSDWDEAKYRINDVHTHTIFAQDFLEGEERPLRFWHYKSAFAEAAHALTGIDFYEAVDMAIKGWEDPEIMDCTHFFAQDYREKRRDHYKKRIESKKVTFPEEMTEKDKAVWIEEMVERDTMEFKRQLDKSTHSIIRTDHWIPFEGVGNAVEELQDLGIRYFFWTHGKTEMVVNNIGRFLNPTTHIPLSHIFDKQSQITADGKQVVLGRKDRDIDNYVRLTHHIAAMYPQDGIEADKICLIDDKEINCQTSRQAGWQKALRVLVHGDDPRYCENSVSIAKNDTGVILQKVIAAVRYARLKHGMNPANDKTKPVHQQEQPRRAKPLI